MKPWPVKISSHLASLAAASSGAAKVIGRQLQFNALENVNTPGFSLDPFNEQSYQPLPGLFHKYRQRALLTVSSTCAVHCRFCFRRHATLVTPDMNKVLSYLCSHPLVTEVVLSGGDPLTLSVATLTKLINQLATLPQLTTLRVHSRVPVADPELAYNFPWDECQKLKKVLVIHCNHPLEISVSTTKLCRDLAAKGVKLYSQSVLLKGVNDRSKILQRLFLQLDKIGVQPYYLHLLDRVQGASHFEVSPLRTQRIHQALQQLLPGYLIPKFVREEVKGKRYLGL